MVKSMIFGAALVVAAGPGPAPIAEPIVQLPQPVLASALEGGMSQPGVLTIAAPAPQGFDVVAPGSQTRVVQVLGRSLSLSLMRADRMGLAVLSVPKRSVVASLPELEPNAFRGLVALESGCRPVGQVQVVGSRNGSTLALATGLSCN